MLGNLQPGPQQLHVYMYCWRLRVGSIEPVEPIATGLYSIWRAKHIIRYMYMLSRAKQEARLSLG